MPAECCFPVEKSLRAEQAALSEPMAIGFYACCKALPLMGAAVIFVTDLLKERLQVAANHGADWTGNPQEQNIVEEIARCQPLLLDAVFECCGEQEALDQALELLKPGGKLMLIGIPAVDRISLVIDRTRRKEICIQNVRRQCACLPPTLALMASGRLKADFMITHRFGFERTREAFELVAAYADGVVKAMIDWSA